jgi:hypothetical protein
MVLHKILHFSENLYLTIATEMFLGHIITYLTFKAKFASKIFKVS